MAKHELEVAEASGVKLVTPGLLEHTSETPRPRRATTLGTTGYTTRSGRSFEPVQETPEPAPQPSLNLQEVVFRQEYTEPQAPTQEPVQPQAIDEDAIALQKLSERLNMKFDSFDDVSQQFNRKATSTQCLSY